MTVVASILRAWCHSVSSHVHTSQRYSSVSVRGYAVGKTEWKEKKRKEKKTNKQKQSRRDRNLTSKSLSS